MVVLMAELGIIGSVVVMWFAEGMLMAELVIIGSSVSLNVTSHMLLNLFRGPVNISLLLRYMFSLLPFIVASHPVSHNFPINNSDAKFNWGKILAKSASLGRFGIGK